MDRKVIEEIRGIFTKGTRVKLLEMDDPQAPPVGSWGTVTFVDDAGNIHVKWDEGGSLALIYGVDKCEIG